MYKTSDLATAAYLSLSGFPPEIERMESRNRVVFCYEDTLEMRDALAVFQRKEGRVEPVQFFNELRSLKSLIYQN